MEGRKIGGPWARIIRNIQAGHVTCGALHRATPDTSMTSIKQQVHKMIQCGLLCRDVGGVLALTEKGRQQS